MRTLIAAAMLACAGTAWAGEEKVRVPEGPGVEKVRQDCTPCHSLDYLRLNSPFLDEKGWQATVNKMAKAYGAPIPAEDVAPLTEYLNRHFGKDAPVAAR